MSFNFQDSSLAKVLDALKSNIMRNTHVATLGIIKQLNNDNTAYVQFIPENKNEDSSNVICYNASPFKLTINDLVVVIFIDKDFKHVLNQYNKNMALTKQGDDVLHSIEHGVIITKYNGTISSKDTYPVSWSATYNDNVLYQTLTMNNGTTLSSSVTIQSGSTWDGVNIYYDETIEGASVKQYDLWLTEYRTEE